VLAVSDVARVDLREGGAWSLAQRAKNDAIWTLARAALFCARRAGRARLVRFGRRLGRVLHAASFGLRSRALQNLAVAFPDLDERERRVLARASFENLGADLADAIASLDTPVETLPMDERSRAILRDALAEGRGVVLPSAHLGPWERLAATLVACGFPLTAIVRESYDPRFDGITGAVRARAGLGTIARGSPGAGARIVRTLRSGGVLGIPMDLKTRAESVPVPLLGGVAMTPIGPARIARRTGAPVVVCTVEPRDILTVTCTRLDPCASDLELTARINAELGRRIRLSPERWLWMHPRFET
jgi:KDO2-lipid IV(A) lauroyltransferase